MYKIWYSTTKVMLLILDLIWHYWYWKPNSTILHPFQFSFFTICITIIRFFLAFLCLQSHLGISAGNVVNWWPAHGFVALKVQVKIQTLMIQSFHFTHPIKVQKTGKTCGGPAMSTKWFYPDQRYQFVSTSNASQNDGEYWLYIWWNLWSERYHSLITLALV